eukprot:GHVS01044852.1.p1 GENE.GHVS01044852.1~~GHVS01044852.1.p1  ORF type:complete len:125 (-),score=8.43 GHVS01044852.1:398-772(-)
MLMQSAESYGSAYCSKEMLACRAFPEGGIFVVRCGFNEHLVEASALHAYCAEHFEEHMKILSMILFETDGLRGSLSPMSKDIRYKVNIHMADTFVESLPDSAFFSGELQQPMGFVVRIGSVCFW